MIIPICKASATPNGEQPCGKCDRCESMGYTAYPQSYERKPFDHAEYLREQDSKSAISHHSLRSDESTIVQP